MKVIPTGRDSANCDPLVLRDGQFTRLVFKPTLVNNYKDGQKPVLGCFIYQKKKKKDEWEDIWEDVVGGRISDITAGSGLKLELSTSELDLVVKYVSSLYGFYDQHRIPGSAVDVIMHDTLPAMNSNTAGLVSQIISEGGVQGLSELLKWAAETGNSNSVVQQLERLDVKSIQRINTLSGVSGLKKLLEEWHDQQDNGKEEYWQDVLSNNPFVLSQLFAAPLMFIGEKMYVGGKGIENRGGGYPDYIAKSASTGNLVIFEIKEPTTPLIGPVYRKPDVFPPSKEVTGAVAQVARYKDSILKNFYSVNHQSDVDFRAINPKCVVVVGHTRLFRGDRMKVESFDLYRNNLGDCQVVTYDELFGKTATLVTLLEGTTDEQPPF